VHRLCMIFFTPGSPLFKSALWGAEFFRKPGASQPESGVREEGRGEARPFGQNPTGGIPFVPPRPNITWGDGLAARRRAGRVGRGDRKESGSRSGRHGRGKDKEMRAGKTMARRGSLDYEGGTRVCCLTSMRTDQMSKTEGDLKFRRAKAHPDSRPLSA